MTKITDQIILYETGGLSDEDSLKLFAKLIKSGMAWSLQGSYGRMASRLIDAKLIDKEGNINWKNVIDY